MQTGYDIKQALLHFLKERYPGDLLIFKNSNELQFIKSYIRRVEGVNATVQPVLTPELLIQDCSKCKGIVEKKPAYGTGENGVMIVLNAPRMANRAELRIHREESVALLKKMVNAIDLELHQCYVTNLIKCESGDSFTKPSDMLKNCLEILKAEIDFVNPKIGIIMGEIIPLQPVIKSVKGVIWYNTEHTISLIKNPGLKRPAWETLKNVRNRYAEIIKGGR